MVGVDAWDIATKTGEVVCFNWHETVSPLMPANDAATTRASGVIILSWFKTLIGKTLIEGY